MLEEIQDLIEDIASASKSDPNHVVDLQSTFKLSVINILWAIVGGKRFQRDDINFVNFVSFIDKFMRSTNIIGAIIPIPAWLLKLFPFVGGWLGFNARLVRPLQEYCEVNKVVLRYITKRKRPSIIFVIGHYRETFNE